MLLFTIWVTEKCNLRECSYSGYCEAVRCKYYNYLNNNHLLKPNENQCSIEHIKYKVWKKYGEQFIK